MQPSSVSTADNADGPNDLYYFEAANEDFDAGSMSMMQTHGISGGDVGASYKFHLQYPVTVESVSNKDKPPQLYHNFMVSNLNCL